MTIQFDLEPVVLAIGPDHGLRGKFSVQPVGMGFNGLSFYPEDENGVAIDGALIYFDTSWGGDDPRCSTCGDTGRWESTTESAPDVLVDLGECPDCDAATLGTFLRVYVNKLNDIGDDLERADAPMTSTDPAIIAQWVVAMTAEVLATQFS